MMAIAGDNILFGISRVGRTLLMTVKDLCLHTFHEGSLIGGWGLLFLEQVNIIVAQTRIYVGLCLEPEVIKCLTLGISNIASFLGKP